MCIFQIQYFCYCCKKRIFHRRKTLYRTQNCNCYLVQICVNSVINEYNNNLCTNCRYHCDTECECGILPTHVFFYPLSNTVVMLFEDTCGGYSWFHSRVNFVSINDID